MLFFNLNTQKKFDINQEEIVNVFFDNLKKDLHLQRHGIGNLFYQEIEIPINAFNIDNETIGNCEELIKFAIKKYIEEPIPEFDNKSLVDLGFEIEFCKKIDNSKLNALLDKFKSELQSNVITEDILWKNMSDVQKKDVFAKNFEQIQTKDHELIIVDPYIFATEEDDYCGFLAAIINAAKASSYIVVTDSKNYNKKSFDKVQSNIKNKLHILFSSEFHDRFWIANRKKGFITGTSFNGIGKKFSIISSISDEDVALIVNELINKN